MACDRCTTDSSQSPEAATLPATISDVLTDKTRGATRASTCPKKVAAVGSACHNSGRPRRSSRRRLCGSCPRGRRVGRSFSVLASGVRTASRARGVAATPAASAARRRRRLRQLGAMHVSCVGSHGCGVTMAARGAFSRCSAGAADCGAYEPLLSTPSAAMRMYEAAARRCRQNASVLRLLALATRRRRRSCPRAI